MTRDRLLWKGQSSIDARWPRLNDMYAIHVIIIRDDYSVYGMIPYQLMGGDVIEARRKQPLY
jgi:hypothetical protein